ncbi:MAG: type II toxin-antitoxin system PemK/MazF family toxin [Actinomycetaceae bacterium]|nr:type II toxin-antitoxin system PemK/MazF family toxin [Actinomycetaceae bacterium]
MLARGEIWWADFGDPVGSEPGFRRPALVVSSDRFNRSRIRTLMVAALTSNLRLAAAPGNVEIPRGVAGLAKDSVVNVSQTLVVDRSRLVELAGTLPYQLMFQVDEGLRLLLDL